MTVSKNQNVLLSGHTAVRHISFQTKFHQC